MRSISQQFREGVRDSYQEIVIHAEVLSRGVVISSLDEVLVSGSIEMNYRSRIQRTCDIRLVDETGDLIPDDWNDLLYPVGNELKLYRGLEFPDGTQELIPLGVFRVSRPRFADEGSRLQISVVGYDRGKPLERARFTDPYIIVAGTNYTTAIQNLIINRLPGYSLDFSQFQSTTRTTPRLVFEEQGDPLQAVSKMAESIGMDFFFDGDGRPILRPVPDVSTTLPSETYAEDEDDVVIQAERELNEEQTYNHVIATGESTSNASPVRAEAFDNDSESPTYWERYGDVPTWLVSSYITTEAQAADAAVAHLRRVTGIIENVSFGMIVNPAHEPGDVVLLRRPRLKIDEIHVLDSLTVPLGYDAAMSVGTRRRKG